MWLAFYELTTELLPHHCSILSDWGLGMKYICRAVETRIKVQIFGENILKLLKGRQRAFPTLPGFLSNPILFMEQNIA